MHQRHLEKELKVFPGETLLRLEVFRPGISTSWKELNFQALSLDFMCCLPVLPSSQSLRAGLAQTCCTLAGSFPLTSTAFLKPLFLPSPLQPILSSSLQLLPVLMSVLQTMSLFLQPSFGQT